MLSERLLEEQAVGTGTLTPALGEVAMWVSAPLAGALPSQWRPGGAFCLLGHGRVGFSLSLGLCERRFLLGEMGPGSLGSEGGPWARP